MDRPRRISTALLNCSELRGVSPEAEVLAHRLPLACDDFGRVRLDGDVLAKKLFPRHPEARGVIDHWCRELEGSGFIERYRVETGDYIRLHRWAEDQAIKSPRPSDLPPSPTENVASPAQIVEAPAVKRADTAPAPVVHPVTSRAVETGDRAAEAPDDESDEHFDVLMARLWK